MFTIGESLGKKQRKITVKANQGKSLFQSKPIIILHGWGSSSASFEAVKNLLSQKGFPVYTMDLPGFGKALPPREPWSVQDYAEFVYEFAEREKLGEFYILGHSFGGRIAIKFAVGHPGKLLGVILYAAAGIKPAKTFKNKLFLILTRIGKPFFSLPVLNYLKIIMTKAIYILAGTRDYYQAKGVMKETMKKIISEDLTPLLPLVKVKTLIIWGEEDKTTPLADALIMKEKIADSELKIIKDSGHSAHKEKPEEFVDIVSSFLLKQENDGNF